MKLTIPFGALAAILCFSQARGQSALDGFDPHANGAIRVVVQQPDGKILIGGDFTAVTPNNQIGFKRNHIARLNIDGTLDLTFNPDANSTVRAIAVQADGSVVVGGDFTSFGTQSPINRGFIARLNKTTGVPDSTFIPNADNIVRAIAIQADGRILAGGDFKTIGGQGRNGIARLSATNGAADAFNPNAVGGKVVALAVQQDGGILVGGSFSSIAGQTRFSLARLTKDGVADSFDPKANGVIFSLAVQADGKVWAAGSFTTIGGKPRNHVARLNSDKGDADSFDPNANGDVFSITIQTDSKVVLAGAFTSVGGQTHNRIARLNAIGTLDNAFTPSASATVFTTAMQQDAKILVGGDFTQIGPSTRPFIARLEIDGRLDQTITDVNLTSLFNAFPDVQAIALQTDGKILIGGNFISISGVTRNGVARLNTDGTLDMAFDPNTDGEVLSFAVDQNSRVLLGGSFGHVGGQTRHNIARVDGTSGAVDDFDPSANGNVESIVVQPDAKILVGGTFDTIGGQPRNLIARLDPATGLADSFDVHAIGQNVTLPIDTIDSIVVQPDGQKMLVGGFFSSIGGQLRNNIARVDLATGLADSFNPSAQGGGLDGIHSNLVETITLDANGNILVGGFFTIIGGQVRNHVARLNPITGLADSFNPNVLHPLGNEAVHSISVQADRKVLIAGHFKGLSPNGGPIVGRNGFARLASDGTVDAFDPFALDANIQSGIFPIALESDGKILVGGFFTAIGGQPRRAFARLTNDVAALQHLSVSQTQVSLSRGGSSPQFTRATFESSTDNVHFAFLGNAQQSGTNWVLSGLSLPTGQNLVIRARGFYRSGDDNGSESVTGTRQDAFFPGSFVIGDLNAVVGQRVVFWSAQWSKSNSLSGGSAPNNFKGFANVTSTVPAACGGTWSTDSGNGAGAPSGVPASINVIVASSITQSGGAISGDVAQTAVVQPDPGYDGDPGHPGAGTVISLGCDGP